MTFKFVFWQYTYFYVIIYVCLLNHFLNFPQHVQKGTVSLENISTGLQEKNKHLCSKYVQQKWIKTIFWILVTFKILAAKISNLLSCPWTLQLISKPDFKWCILNKNFFMSKWNELLFEGAFSFSWACFFKWYA